AYLRERVPARNGAARTLVRTGPALLPRAAGLSADGDGRRARGAGRAQGDGEAIGAPVIGAQSILTLIAFSGGNRSPLFLKMLCLCGRIFGRKTGPHFS